jgi:hypothetical protein
MGILSALLLFFALPQTAAPSELTASTADYAAYVTACQNRKQTAFDEHSYYWYNQDLEAHPYCLIPSPFPDFIGQKDWTK